MTLMSFRRLKILIYILKPLFPSTIEMDMKFSEENYNNAISESFGGKDQMVSPYHLVHIII